MRCVKAYGGKALMIKARGGGIVLELRQINHNSLVATVFIRLDFSKALQALDLKALRAISKEVEG